MIGITSPSSAGNSGIGIGAIGSDSGADVRDTQHVMLTLLLFPLGADAQRLSMWARSIP